jgi:hypothetical protein
MSNLAYGQFGSEALLNSSSLLLRISDLFIECLEFLTAERLSFPLAGISCGV